MESKLGVAAEDAKAGKLLVGVENSENIKKKAFKVIPLPLRPCVYTFYIYKHFVHKSFSIFHFIILSYSFLYIKDKRAAHYNEFEQIKLMREKMKNGELDDDEDEDEDDDKKDDDKQNNDKK